MKKLFLTTALAVASLFSFGAFAQQKSQTCNRQICETQVCEKDACTPKVCGNPQCEGPENCKFAECPVDTCRGGAACDAKVRYNKDRRGHRPGAGVSGDQFACLNITPEQRAQLDSLQNAIFAQAKNKVDERKQVDPKKSTQDLSKERRESVKQNRTDYLHKVRDIVGPDQYVIYLENLVLETKAPVMSRLRSDNKAERKEIEKKEFVKETKELVIKKKDKKGKK